MKRGDCFELIHQLYAYFRMFQPPTGRTIDDWHEEIKHVDVEAIDYIKKEICQRENLPRNIPLTIKGIYAEWKRRNALDSEVVYQEVEDYRFPIEYLQYAVDLGDQKGEASMLDYCRRVGMPKNDIDRVKFVLKNSQEVTRAAVNSQINKSFRRIDDDEKA